MFIMAAKYTKNPTPRLLCYLNNRFGETPRWGVSFCVVPTLNQVQGKFQSELPES